MAARRTQQQVALDREGGGGYQDEEPRIKLRKTKEPFDWDDGKVGGKILPNYGKAVLALEFQKKPDHDRRQQTVTELINSTDQLTVHTQTIHLYQGFKKGLVDLLQLIKEKKNSEDCPILLLHGIPGMGKSCLAKCLAYYLAIDGDKAAYINMASNASTVGISNYFLNSANRWTIFDQCNINCIDFKLFLNYTDADAMRGDRSPRKPIIMFTAGHYLPPETWYDNIFIDFRLINLKVDKTVVERLKGNKRGVVDTEDLLKVTNVFGRVLDILTTKCSGKKVTKVTTNDMLESFDKFVEVIESNSQKLDLFWLLVPRLVQAKKADVEESENNSEAWAIKPEVVYCLDHILNLNGNPQQGGRTSIMNWLCVTAWTSSEETRKSLEDGSRESSEFCIYRPGEYFYYFPQVKKLHEVLNKDYYPSSLASRYTTFYDTYQVLTTMKNSCTQCFRCNAFESLIAMGCELKKVCIQVSTSPAKPRQTFRVYQTQKVLAKDVEDLWKDVDGIRQKGSKEIIWCELNVPGQKPFKGFDFAYVEVADSQYLRFDLLQATVNAESHNKTHMLTVLDEVERAFGTKVQPYFLVPKGNESEDTLVGNRLIPVASFDIDPSTFLRE